MKRLIEEDATDFERLLLRSAELDVAPEGAAERLLDSSFGIDRLEDASVVPLHAAQRRVPAAVWLLVACFVGVAVIVVDRQRHRDVTPIVQDSPRVAPTIEPAPVPSGTPAAEMPLPASPPPTVSVVQRALPKPTPPAPSVPAPALSTLLRQASAEHGSNLSDAPFDRGAAAAALKGVSLDRCRGLAGPSGAGHVVVTFGPSGAADSAVVDAPFAGTERGACVAAMYAAVRVPPFTGSPVRVGKSFVLQ